MTPATITPSQKPASKVVNLGGGARVIFADAPPAGSSLRVSTAGAPGLPSDWRPLATPVHLQVENGSIGKGATLEFAIPPGAPVVAGAIGIATYDEKAGRWVTVPAAVDAVRHVIRAHTTHFSWWNPFAWDWSGAFAATNQVVGQLVGKRASAPACNSAKPGWVRDVVGISNSDAIVIRSCAQSQGSVLDVHIVNNRPYGQVLTYGSSVKWGWHTSGTSGLDVALNAAMDKMVGGGALYLPPLASASVGIYQLRNGGSAGFHIGPSKGSLFVDFLRVVAPEVLERLGGANLTRALAAECGTALLTREVRLSGSIDDVRAQILDLSGCADKAFLKAAASGLLDQHKVTELAATFSQLKNASTVGMVLKFYDVEWKVLDLFVDGFIAPPLVDFGNGFKVYAKYVAPATPAPSAPAGGSSKPGTGSPPPVTPSSLRFSAVENPFVCDGASRILGYVQGARAGEAMSFTSPDVSGLRPGSANSAGSLQLRWDCSPGEAGKVWAVTAHSATGGSTTFTVTGAAPAAPPPPPAPPAPSVRGFVIEDSYFLGTWARRDPWNGTWHTKANKPTNAAYWFPNGLGIGVDCTLSAAAYEVRFLDGRRETWSWWAHVTDNTWVPVATLREASVDGSQGMRTC